MMKVHSSEEFTFVPAQGAPIDHKALSEFLDDPSVEFWVHFADDDLGTTSCTLVGGFGSIDCNLFGGDRSLVGDIFLVRGAIEIPGTSRGGLNMYMFIGTPIDEASLNVFKLAPFAWFRSAKSRQDAISAYQSAPFEVRQILGMVLQTPSILERFCSVPSSIANHHNFRGGNLEHTIETVLQVRCMLANYGDIDKELSELWAWLHDLGKIDAYISFDPNLDVYHHSDQGKKMGLYALTLKLLFEQFKGHELTGSAKKLISDVLHIATSVSTGSSDSGHHDYRDCRFEKEKILVQKCDRLSAGLNKEIHDIRVAQGSIFL